MDDTPEQGARLPASLTLLKWLVIALMLTMIGGVITVVALLVTRMPAAFDRAPVMPSQITLPEGARATAYTQGIGWFAVVTEDQRLLIFAEDGALRQEIPLGGIAP